MHALTLDSPKAAGGIHLGRPYTFALTKCSFRRSNIHYHAAHRGRISRFRVHASSSRWRKETVSDGSIDAKELIYIATFQLEGLEGLEGGIAFMGYEMPDILAQHFAVLVERQEDKSCMIFDFLPESPTAPATAVALLSGASVQGVLRQRRIRRVPARRCRCLGPAVADAESMAAEFNAKWDTRLQLFRNDCRNHAQQLATVLTGQSIKL